MELSYHLRQNLDLKDGLFKVVVDVEGFGPFSPEINQLHPLGLIMIKYLQNFSDHPLLSFTSSFLASEFAI